MDEGGVAHGIVAGEEGRAARKEVILRTAGLTKSYYPLGGEVRVLRGVDLEVAPGESVGVAGASGVGKSTLLHLLGALDRPTGGEVWVEGREIFRLSDGELARYRNGRVGFVFQFHHLLPEFSALENVMMPALLAGGSKREARKKAEALLEEVGLAQRLAHRPGELSGGEQQRVALARALTNDPAIVLADEPTGNLDRENSEVVRALLVRLNRSRGLTLIVMTHNMELVDRMDRAYRLVDGRLVAIR
ncbi:MAG: ABC transporter ATP-binding protein [Nitrospinota bacterium]